MKLNENHRQALVERLKKAMEKERATVHRREHLMGEEDESKRWMADWAEVDLWLLEKEQQLIEEAIKSNELDNW